MGNEDKRGRKKEKEGRGFGRLPSFFFPSFLLVFLMAAYVTSRAKARVGWENQEKERKVC